MESNATAPSFCLDSAMLKISISAILTVLILITVAGNVVVCLAVGFTRRLRSLTNCFIVSLAATDLLLGLLVLPFSAIHQLSCRWDFGRVFCSIYTSLDVMLCTASILNLFMISLDRYCAVTAPLRYPVLVTPGRVATSLVFIWVISITLSFLSIHLGWNSRNETSHDVTPKCKVQVNEVYGLVDGLVTFYLPLLIMCITYYRIFKIAREQAKRINHMGSWKAATIREHKATVALATVMGAFIICWFPYFTVFVYRGLRGDDAVNEVFEAIVLWLGYANSALNPILYAALNRDFRTAYQQLFRCRLSGRSSQGTSLSLDNSQLRRSQNREPRWQEEKPLKLQAWSGAEAAAPQGATDRRSFCTAAQQSRQPQQKLTHASSVSSESLGSEAPPAPRGSQGKTHRKRGGGTLLSLKSQGEHVMPQEALHRKPSLSCTSCSNNLLSCCKSLWGLRFLQRPPGGPPEEPSGELLPEEAQTALSWEVVRTLPSETV